MWKAGVVNCSFVALAMPTDSQLTIIFGQWRKQWKPVGNWSLGSGGNFSGRYATCGGSRCLSINPMVTSSQCTRRTSPMHPPACRTFAASRAAHAPCRHMVRKCSHGPGSLLALLMAVMIADHLWELGALEWKCIFAHYRQKRLSATFYSSICKLHSSLPFSPSPPSLLPLPAKKNPKSKQTPTALAVAAAPTSP